MLQGLGLHYRVVTLCTGDLGFAVGEDLRPRGLAAGPGRVPRDLVVLELRGLPGAPREDPLPRRRPARSRARSTRSTARASRSAARSSRSSSSTSRPTAASSCPRRCARTWAGSSGITKPSDRQVADSGKSEILLYKGSSIPILRPASGTAWRSGRAVEGSGLENRRAQAPGVRIPPPPQALIIE